MKLLTKIGLITITLALTLILLLQIDDNLRPETKRWIESTEQKTNSDSQAYFYFLGLMAPEGKDPIKVGKAIHKIVKSESANSNSELNSEVDNSEVDTHELKAHTDFIDPYLIKDGLTFHKSDSYCKPFFEDCFNQLINNPAEIQNVLTQNSILLDRYQTFLALPNYHNMQPIGHMGSMPHFQNLMSANNLVLLDILVNSQSDSAVNNRFFRLLNNTRVKLEQSNSIIDKMVYVALMRHSLEFYNLLYKHQVIDSPQTVKALTQEERSLAKAMNYESLSAARVINFDQFQWYDIYTNAILKENMMTNDYHQQAKKISKFSILPADQQIQEDIKTSLKPEFGFLDKVRNYAGTILFRIGSSIYFDYVYRISDIDAKIAVLNWRIQQPANDNIDQEYLNNHPTAELNPYKTGDFIIKDDTLICVPLEIRDHRNTRCVQL